MRYISAERMTEDDFGQRFTLEEGEVVYDAVTMNGAWATMTQASYDLYARPGGLGLGKGQKYVRNAAGELHCTEGYEEPRPRYILCINGGEPLFFETLAECKAWIAEHLDFGSTFHTLSIRKELR